MATSKPALAVIVSPAAEDDLIGIWGDNVELYKDVGHADNYLVFLRTEINKLATKYASGRTVKGFPEFRFITMKKSRRGHGHYAIFDVDETEGIITVLRIFSHPYGPRRPIEKGIPMTTTKLAGTGANLG